MAEPDYPDIGPPLNVPEEEPPETKQYYKRDILDEFDCSDGTMVQVIRYFWRDEVVKLVGHRTCIRFRRKWRVVTAERFGQLEAMGVPEQDFHKLVEAIKKVKTL